MIEKQAAGGNFSLDFILDRNDDDQGNPAENSPQNHQSGTAGSQHHRREGQGKD